MRDARIRLRDGNAGVDLEDLRQRLSRCCGAENEIVVSERKGIVFAGDGAWDRIYAQCSHGNHHVFDFLEVGGSGFVAQYGKVVGACFSNLCPHLLFYQVGQFDG